MRFKKVAGIIVVSLLLAGATGYVLYALLTFEPVEKQLKCRDLIVSIQASVPLITEDEVHLMLREQGLHPIGVMLSDLRTEQIERFLKEHPYVKKVKCYHDPAGQAFLYLELRTPRFLVLGNENFYMDVEGHRLPAKPGVMAYVPVVTGRVTRTMLQGELYELVSYIAGHDFWNAQVQQIHVRDDHRIELVPRVGDALIMLGTTDHYRLKLDRLMRLYQQAFNVMGWNGYQKLDLQFENQIVATKKKVAGK
jgi:cell division protein FtsQ